ncbi:hypothetical protein [Phycisphaera mikurensis]|uniref:Putative beta-agarase n=1 Tax=Phycisphaera mikurensis (strain NBRC 102666 / KCTC 22515 / FYK2301M01) TaxID=1142394 RepID=I0IGJ5_PHYMF|nr:hypothetical protein [Phycisphaera mikurensis]MBB6442935.1 agarase [Phycisphaera mikurensis]BAM04383.1 putative beta-agarase [Phycisphaera mikurensis NBRC 102666]
MLLACLLPLGHAAAEVALPPSAQADKARLAHLFEVAERHDPVRMTQVNSQEQRLQAVRFGRGTGPVRGEARLEVPADLLPLWSFFKQLQLVGETAGLSVAWRSGSGAAGEASHWYRAEGLNVFQAGSIPAEPGTPLTLILRGEGRLEEVRLQIDDNGIGPVFDESPWSALGADRPVVPVGVEMDLSAKRALGGTTRFEREKFFRVYAAPWGGPWGVLDAVAERGFLPGRQLFKIAPALEVGYPEDGPGKPPFREDPDRPRHTDPAFFSSGWSWPEVEAGIAERYAGLDYALCLDEWPSFNRHAGPGVVNSRGTPADFDAAAETAGRTVKLVSELTGLAPAWVEVKNESDVPYEWSYHGVEGVDAWDLLADFHVKVADAVRAFSPGVKVGGPTSAYPALAVKDWALARRHTAFMDATRGRLDFYSHHFYEGAGLLFEDLRAGGGDTYLLGKATSYLDLLRAHGANTGNTVPFLLTEFGTLTGGGQDHQRWQAIRNWSAYLVQFMQRPDELDLCVPFAIPLLWWDPDHPHALFEPDGDGGWRPTPMARFLDLWEGYGGELLPIASDDPLVSVHAAGDGRTLWVAISNMRSRRVAVDLAAGLAGAEVATADRRRLWLDRGELVWSVEDAAAALAAVELSPEETSILEITLAEPLSPARVLGLSRHYGTRTLLRTGTPQTLTVGGPAGAAASALLRVGVQRENGFTQPLRVSFNGAELEADLAFSAGIPAFDAFVTVEVPAGLVRERNQLVLHQPEPGGTLASAVLLVETERPLP